MTSTVEQDMTMTSTVRRGNKPGRKPLDTEAKNRRTAQNRAAQRAFRERKERKMRDLEEQLKKVEERCQKSEGETQFLRMQVVAMLQGLRRSRDGVRFPQLPVGAEKQPEKQRLWASLVREEQMQYEQQQQQQDFPQQDGNQEVPDDLDTGLVQMPSPHSSVSELSTLDAMEQPDGVMQHVDANAGEYLGDDFYEPTGQSLMPLPYTPNPKSFQQQDIGYLDDPMLQMATAWGGAEPAPAIPSRTLTPSFNQLLGPPVPMPADWYAQDITASMGKGQAYAEPPIYAASNTACPVYEDDMLAYLQ